MPDTIFIFALALVIFGPKKLPEIGRQLGKLVAEFRRASNEFKMQIEEELRSAEQADRQKQLTADAGAPPAATVETRELPLTARPPSTGEIESTESPFKAYSQEADLPLEDDPSREEEIFEKPPSEPTKTLETLVDSRDGEARALEEQTTNHHG